jgi:hypothetical protein
MLNALGLATTFLKLAALRRVDHPVRDRGDVLGPAAALDPVPVVLHHPRGHLWDVVLLMRRHDAQIRGTGQVRPAAAGAGREVLQRVVRRIPPCQR